MYHLPTGKKKKEQQGQGSLFGSLQARGVHRNPLDIWNWCLELGLIFCFYIHLILFFFAFEFGIDHRLMMRVPSVVIKFSAKPFGIKKGIYLQMLSSTHLIVKTLEKHMDQRKKRGSRLLCRSTVRNVWVLAIMTFFFQVLWGCDDARLETLARSKFFFSFIPLVSIWDLFYGLRNDKKGIQPLYVDFYL